MSSSASSAVGIPSRADNLEKIQGKVKKHDQVLWPTVSEKIQEVKAAKRVAATQNPDLEYRTVFHLDLDRALLNGLVVDMAQVAEPSAGWSVTVKGCDCGGFPLIIYVHLGLDTNEPLQIADFIIAPTE
jgi:hypothetical protein